jgi:hypothetical protein
VAGFPVVAPIAAGIIIGIAVGYALDVYFPTEDIVAAMDKYYDDLMARAGWSLYQFERELLWQVWPHGLSPFPY